MKTRAAVLWGLEEKWEVEEVELDPPGPDEVMVRLTASGLCHSDEHLVTGDLPFPLPVVGGHEGAGTVVEVGAGIEDIAEGDSVILTFLPSCGHCSYCARGMGNLCDMGAAIMMGPPDRRHVPLPCSRRRHRPDVPAGHLFRVHGGTESVAGQDRHGYTAGQGGPDRLRRDHRLWLGGAHR